MKQIILIIMICGFIFNNAHSQVLYLEFKENTESGLTKYSVGGVNYYAYHLYYPDPFYHLAFSPFGETRVMKKSEFYKNHDVKNIEWIIRDYQERKFSIKDYNEFYIVEEIDSDSVRVTPVKMSEVFQ